MKHRRKAHRKKSKRVCFPTPLILCIFSFSFFFFLLIFSFGASPVYKIQSRAKLKFAYCMFEWRTLGNFYSNPSCKCVYFSDALKRTKNTFSAHSDASFKNYQRIFRIRQRIIFCIFNTRFIHNLTWGQFKLENDKRKKYRFSFLVSLRKGKFNLKNSIRRSIYCFRHNLPPEFFHFGSISKKPYEK